jgi:hypothetical protein
MVTTKHHPHPARLARLASLTRGTFPGRSARIFVALTTSVALCALGIAGAAPASAATLPDSPVPTVAKPTVTRSAAAKPTVTRPAAAKPAAAKPAAALPATTYCQGPQADQPAAGPTKVIMLELENESSSSISGSPDAPFENGTLSGQCGNFSTSAMHSTTHPSESNYFAEVSGLNAAINSGTDALARFGLSDCPPDAQAAICTFGGGHFANTVPSLFSQIEQKYGTGGWKTYADDMVSACERNDDNVYATTPTTTYRKYVSKHNPAVFFNGIACASQDVPSGDWRNGQGALYNDLMGGTLPAFSYLEPNDIENGHDPSTVNGVTVAGGKNQIANIDAYLSSVMAMIKSSPDYQSGNLVVMITFDEGTKAGPISGEDTVGENCADPNISPLATSCQVQTWMVGRYVPSITYSSYMNQFGLLAATQRILGLSPLLGHAADASTPDIVNGTIASPDPFNLAPTGIPPVATAPGPPSGLVATAGSGSVSLAWTAPTMTGGSAITDYLVEDRISGTSSWQTVADGVSTSVGATVPALTNGTGYDFRVSAINAVGTGSPGAPATATPGASGPELLPDAGFESGNGGWVAFSVGSLARVTSPVRSGAEALKIAAVGASASLVGMTQNSVVSKSVAGTAYTAQCWVQPTAANLNVQLHFVEYTQNFGSYRLLDTTALTKLAVGSWTLVKVTSAAVVSGERMIPQIYSTNETTATGSIVYDDCSVTTGTGAPVLTAPGAPTAVSATAGDESASVSFSAPVSSGGLPITAYRVVATPGGATATGAGSPLTVTGLTNGSAYTFTAVATNSVGSGAASAASAPVTPAGLPGVPSALTAVPGHSHVDLSWTAGNPNGSPITGYELQYSLSGAENWQPVGTAASPDPATSAATHATVTGLDDGTSYDFQVAAISAVGESDFSDLAAATPVVLVPGAPNIGSATGADGSAVVTFTAPTDTGGDPVLDYTVTSSPDGVIATGNSSPITVTGLTNGTAYTFTVTARSDAGTGAASAATNVVTPGLAAALPDAPTAVVATPGNRTASVVFTPPANSGGAPITGYTVTASPGGATATGTGSPLVVIGLTNGTGYTFSVTATNIAGTGAASVASPVVVPYAELLPDAGFESGNGGWVAFSVGALARVSSPVRSGGSAMSVAAVGASASLVGLTQNSVVTKSVAGSTYSAQCWVQPTSANLNVQVHFVEYTPTFSSYVLLGTTSVAKLTPGTWTLVKVTSVAVRSGERMIPQIYSTNETTATGRLLYDDCSVSVG